MVLVVAALQDQAEKYGAYVGIAAFFGLALLTVLYFAQARELKRLREWAGRSPERTVELEARMLAQAQAVKAEPIKPKPKPLAAPVAAKPVAKPHPGTIVHPAAAAIPAAATAAAAAAIPAAATAAGAAPATATATATPVPATSPPDGDTGGNAPPPEEEAAATNGAAVPPAPAPATPPPPRAPAPPPARRTAPAPAPAARRPGVAPEPEHRSWRGLALVGAAAAVAVAGLIFLGTQVLGGEEAPTPAPNQTPPAGATPDADAGGGTAAESAEEGRSGTVVSVLNGTTTNGLAQSIAERLTGAGYPESGNVDTAPDQSQASTTIYYAEGERRQAADVADLIRGGKLSPMDADNQALAGPDAKLLVIVGADKTP